MSDKPRPYEEQYQPRLAGALLWVPMTIAMGVLYAGALGLQSLGVPVVPTVLFVLMAVVGAGGVAVTGYLVLAPIAQYYRDLYAWKTQKSA